MRVRNQQVKRARSLRAGTVLLEVVLALVLFVAAAAIITSAINSALDSTERQRLHLHASNLAATALAEIQLGIRSIEQTAAADMEAPFTNWTCEVIIGSDGQELSLGSTLSLVEVVIRHKESELVYRQAQLLEPGKGAESTTFETTLP